MSYRHVDEQGRVDAYALGTPMCDVREYRDVAGYLFEHRCLLGPGHAGPHACGCGVWS